MAFDEYLDFATDKGLGNAHGSLVLFRHRQFAAFLFHLVRKLASHGAGAGAILPGISKNAEAFEAGFADKLQQGFETGFGLAGKANNESSAQSDAGNTGANLFYEIHNVLLGGF